MTETDLRATTFEIPDDCKNCEYFYPNRTRRDKAIHCPANVLLNSLWRIKQVVDGVSEFDSPTEAQELVRQIPKLESTAEGCGNLLVKHEIESPYTVTMDLSLTNFTVHSPARLLPPHIVA